MVRGETAASLHPTSFSLPSTQLVVHTLLESEALKGIDISRIVIGGFSQGGALALASAYSYHTDFAGILALSCWIPPTMQPKLIEVLRVIYYCYSPVSLV